MANELDFMQGSNDTIDEIKTETPADTNTGDEDTNSASGAEGTDDSFDNKDDENKDNTDSEPDKEYENDLTRDFTWTTDPEVKEYQKQIVEESISNGSLNPRIIPQFFDDIKLHSYTYDYIMQKELVDLHSVTVEMKDSRCYMLKGAFSETFNRVVEFTIEQQFTNYKNREQYKRNTSIFRKYLDMDEICKNKVFFKYNMLVMAGSKILSNYRARAFNDRIDICFLKSDLDKYPNIDKITIYFLPDSYINILDNPLPGLFNGTSLSADCFGNATQIPKIHKFIGFWIDKETNESYMISSISYDKKSNMMHIDELLPTDITKFKLMVIGIDKLHEVTDYDGTATWIEYHTHKMPLPKDDMIVMVLQDGHYVPNDEGLITLEEYYPNIYKITNPEAKNFRLIELYEDNAENEHIIYDNETKPYMDLMSEEPDVFDPSEVSELMLNYKPVKWNFDIQNYLEKYPYHDMNLVSKNDSFLFRMQTLSKMMKNWYMMYDEYQRRTYGFLTGWYHNMANYTEEELKSKLRRTTAIDVDNDPDYIQEFAEPQYLFTYMNNISTGSVNSFCFFVDGKYTLPTKILIYKGYQYVYFPQSIINKDSVIEVERFDGNKFQYRIPVNYAVNTILFDPTFNRNKIPATYKMLNEKGILEDIDDIKVQYADTSGITDVTNLNKRFTMNLAAPVIIKNTEDNDDSTQDLTGDIIFTDDATGNSSTVSIGNTSDDKEEKTNIFTYGTVIDLGNLLDCPTVANNLFLVSTTGEFLNHNEFDTYIQDPILGEVKVDLETSVFIVTPKSKIRIVPRLDTMTDKYIFLCCNNVTYQYLTRESGDDFYKGRNVNMNDRGLINNAEQDISHRLRIFYNGRFITKRSYQVYKYKNYFTPPKFNIPIRPGEDRYFLVSYIGYDERLIYHREEIPSNGVVHMEGKISRPINLVYHDIYLDGYRLTKYDINIVAPFTFIVKTKCLNRLKTLRNIEIYEKVHIPEYYTKFEWSEKSNFILDKLLNQDEDYYHKVIDKLEKVETDPTVENMDMVRDWFYSFFADYIMYRYNNADIRRDLEAYHHLFNENGRLLLNADDRVRYIKSIRESLYFSHDKTIELYGDDPENYPKPDKEEMEITTIEPDDSINVPESTYRQYGYTQEDFDRVYDIPIVFAEDDKTRTVIDPDGTIKIYSLYDANGHRNIQLKATYDPRLDEYKLDPEYDEVQPYATNYEDRPSI